MSESLDTILEAGERIRILKEAPAFSDDAWKFTGEQESPEYYQVNGFRIPLLSDRQVYESTRSLLVDSIEANLEVFTGSEPTAHLPGVEASVEPCPYLHEFRITEGALKKTRQIAELIGEYYHPIPEVAMHLLRHDTAPKGIVTDAVICQNQRVTTTSCNFTSYLGVMFGHDQYYYGGWCHSHAAGSPFHSSTDDRNVLRSVRTKGIRARFRMNELAIDVNFLPSLVVNALGDNPYATIGVNYWSCRDEEERSFLREVTPIVVDDEYDIITDEEVLTSHINRWVTVER